MTSLRADRLLKTRPSAVTQVECTVRVSPTLARLIRKCAEKEAGGSAPTDALLSAAGVAPAELASLRQNAELSSAEIADLRAQAAQALRQISKLESEAAHRDDRIALLQDDIGTATEALHDERRQCRDMAAALRGRDEQLARSLSLDGLDSFAAEALEGLRHRLEEDNSAELKAAIANLGHPQILALSGLIDRRAQRLPLIRWLLS
ncbi:MAG TPA: hypothetical protein HPQ04_06245 [Rhodospirillaceae bacterium]|nr:hypothetical protein [Rhodospirillaceae bacterium]